MEHQSLYRKYRSRSFEEVVGQQHVTRTLQNALSTGRVAHAYLFSGPRGTGKTSTARLLARALNCESGPTPTPCGTCALCMAVATSRTMDVVEVDAASETGIDNVREVIINNARYAPTEGRFKVYIIDEVHDLSRAAFDGLLKTLEEPPAHVVFVLATTEIHKVPATIISRCQRFEFRRGTLEEVRSRVQHVASEENVQLEPAAATLIARSAEGGWRDALSLLEQVMAFTGDSITAADVSAVLGTVRDESLADLTRCIADANATAALNVLDALLSEGKDIRQLLHNLADFLRDCVLQSLGGAPASDRPLVSLSVAEGTRLLELTSRAEREMRWNTQYRLVLELMLLRMVTPLPAPSLLHAAAGERAPEHHSKQPAQTAAHAPIDSAPNGTRSEEPMRHEMAPHRLKPAAAPPAARPPASQEVGGDSPASTTTLVAIQQQWKLFLNRVGARSRQLQALLREASPAAFEAGVLTLQFRQQYHCQTVEEIATRRKVEEVLTEVFGGRFRVTCTLSGEAAAAAPTPNRKTVEPVTREDIERIFPGWDIAES